MNNTQTLFIFIILVLSLSGVIFSGLWALYRLIKLFKYKGGDKNSYE